MRKGASDCAWTRSRSALRSFQVAAFFLAASADRVAPEKSKQVVKVQVASHGKIPSPPTDVVRDVRVRGVRRKMQPKTIDRKSTLDAVDAQKSSEQNVGSHPPSNVKQALGLPGNDGIWQNIQRVLVGLEEECKDGHPPRGAECPTREIQLLKNLRPCTSCSNPRRFGEKNDGGYVFCEEHLKNITAAYSFGINGYDGWGADVSDVLRIPVFEFDCTNSRRPPCPPGKSCNFHFSDLCVVAKGREKKGYETLEQLLARNGHGKRGDTMDLLMQLDVEGYEWKLLGDPHTAGALREFAQLSVEFHDVTTQRFADTAMQLRAILNLREHFEIAHLHGNNCCGMLSHTEAPMGPHIGDTYAIPRVLEILFVNRRLLREQVTRPEPDTGACDSDPPHSPLDAPNLADQNELPIPHLPEFSEVNVTSHDPAAAVVGAVHRAMRSGTSRAP